MNGKLMKVSALLMTLMMVLSSAAVSFAAAGGGEKDESTKTSTAPALEEGTFVPGQAVVMFRSGAVKDSSSSLAEVKKLRNVDTDFGDSMGATGEATEAAKDAKSEVKILSESLEDYFTIEDSIAFDDDLTVALISSGRYDTAALIEKLSENDDVISAEPNYIREPQSYDYSYDLNDQMNTYNYQANTPLAHNESGSDVTRRGYNTEVPMSTNSGSVQLTDEQKEKELVVAVMDSGITLEHEDLKNMLWENPGDIGLEGEHGYNFYNNCTDITDTFYHGSHVSGIIAAQANNNVGIAGTGTASGANVKIMMLSTNSAGEDYEVHNSYKEMGAFNYMLKAKQRGVNIVASSNSWGSPSGLSTIYDEIIDRLGEEGIVTFVCAGNDWIDLDNNSTISPASGDSPYMVVVGAADPEGEPAGFSNWGKSSVDVFAPGVNVLSAVCYSSYFPNIYTKEKRIETTEYYGEFNNDMVISDDHTQVTPSKADTDESVKSFGASVFHAQAQPYKDPSADADKPDATLELSKSTERTFTASDNTASLKVTIHDPKPSEEYYLYFPYDKNPETTGIKDTKFSIYAMNSIEEGDKGYSIMGGDVIVDENGDCELYNYGIGPQDPVDWKYALDDTHICKNSSGGSSDPVMSAEDLEESGKTAGIGICVRPLGSKEVSDIHLYLDSVALSRPGAEITPETSYDIASGTSMATPACAGAYAAYAAGHPIEDGQTGSEYALQNKAGFLSCVTRTDELKDKCATGGYIDLTHISENNPAITDAVCSLEDDTVTIYGERLNGGYTLKYRKLEDKEGEEITLPSGNMEVDFAEDGKSAVIRNARALFGTYLEFDLYDGDSLRATNSFFLVKGQKRLQVVYKEEYPHAFDNDSTTIHLRKLLTDTEGQTLYGFESDTGVVSKYDGTQFSDFRNTDLKDAAVEFIKKEKGLDVYEGKHDIEVELKNIRNPLYMDNRLYHFLDITYTQGSETVEDGETEYHYMASIDYTSDKPEWSFTEIKDYYDMFCEGFGNEKYAAMQGKIYFIGTDELSEETSLTSFVYSYDVASGEVAREEDMPANLEKYNITVKDEKLYVMLGGGVSQETPKSKLSRKVYCFDGKSWTTLEDIPFTGKFESEGGEDYAYAEGVCAPVKNGFVFLNCTVDGAGNTFLYDLADGKCIPLYYTFNDFKADKITDASAVETKDGVYYLYDSGDKESMSFTMCLLPAETGEYKSSYAALSKSSASLKAGQELDLKVISGKAKSWKSSDSKTAKVQGGKVTALKKGTAKITATLTSGDTVTCTVKVKTSPKLSKKSITVKKGKTKTVKITGKAKSVNNTYKNTKVAKVTSKKTAAKIKVKGLKKGSTTLKIKVNGVTLKLKVKVR